LAFDLLSEVRQPFIHIVHEGFSPQARQCKA
jgi:hypothetical protein